MLIVLHFIKQLTIFVRYGRVLIALMRVITSIRSLSGTTYFTLDLQIRTEVPFYRVLYWYLRTFPMVCQNKRSKS